MREGAVPGPELPPLTRSAVACIAAILEVATTDVPAPPAGHPQPWTVWGDWLGQRGMGLVPVIDPRRFGWPGPWLALLPSAAGEGTVAAVAFGVPPGLAWNPLGGLETFDDVEAGYVVAPTDAALWERVVRGSSRVAGRVAALALAPHAEAPMVRVETATARAGRGLEGDRYFEGRGTFSNAHSNGRDLTLIEAEVLDDMRLASGQMVAEATRRNIVTRGIDLNVLVGRRFSVGEVTCIGRRWCEPCAHLERLTEPGVLRGLVHRGGLRADVLSDGAMRIGDPVLPG